jgi:hypothetical protein
MAPITGAALRAVVTSYSTQDAVDYLRTQLEIPYFFRNRGINATYSAASTAAKTKKETYTKCSTKVDTIVDFYKEEEKKLRTQISEKDSAMRDAEQKRDAAIAKASSDYATEMAELREGKQDLEQQLEGVISAKESVLIPAQTAKDEASVAMNQAEAEEKVSKV